MERENNILDSIVDQAILLYEQGEVAAAYRLMNENQISVMTAHRVFKYPEKRRQYINDYLNGF